MAKLIKRSAGELEDEAFDSTLTGYDGLQRNPIIDRRTSEAKTDAQQIRARAEERAREILAKAKAAARKVIAAAEQEAAQLKEQADRTGYEEGKARGAAELTETVVRAAQRMREIEEQAEPQLLQLALTIARRIIGNELELHPEALVGLVKQALSDKAGLRRDVSLRVHPEDLAVIREHKPELLEVLSRAKEIGIREDPAVERHGVIIETDAGTIDAQLETQLAVFEKVLQARLRSG